jgi:hypothetical protein
VSAVQVLWITALLAAPPDVEAAKASLAEWAKPIKSIRAVWDIEDKSTPAAREAAGRPQGQVGTHEFLWTDRGNEIQLLFTQDPGDVVRDGVGRFFPGIRKGAGTGPGDTYATYSQIPAGEDLRPNPTSLGTTNGGSLMAPPLDLFFPFDGWLSKSDLDATTSTTLPGLIKISFRDDVPGPMGRPRSRTIELSDRPPYAPRRTSQRDMSLGLTRTVEFVDVSPAPPLAWFPRVAVVRFIEKPGLAIEYRLRILSLNEPLAPELLAAPRDPADVEPNIPPPPVARPAAPPPWPAWDIELYLPILIMLAAVPILAVLLIWLRRHRPPAG